jgi:hypothetical protein
VAPGATFFAFVVVVVIVVIFLSVVYCGGTAMYEL